MPPKKRDIGSGELEVLKALWDQGPSTVREVLDGLLERGRPLAYNTVQTVLRRLEEKAFVTKDTRAQSHVFRARVTRDQMGRRRVKDLVEGVYDGAVGSVVMQLIQNGKLGSDELVELQELLDRLSPHPNHEAARSSSNHNKGPIKGAGKKRS